MPVGARVLAGQSLPGPAGADRSCPRRRRSFRETSLSAWPNGPLLCTPRPGHATANRSERRRKPSSNIGVVIGRRPRGPEVSGLTARHCSLEFQAEQQLLADLHELRPRSLDHRSVPRTFTALGHFESTRDRSIEHRLLLPLEPIELVVNSPHGFLKLSKPLGDALDLLLDLREWSLPYTGSQRPIQGLADAVGR